MYVDPPVGILNAIYADYCRYKKFDSVMPLFDSQFTDVKNDIYGYPDLSGKIVAFSMVRRHDSISAESLQFAWDYTEPSLRLGIRSLEHECAIYKHWGFKYLYLGQVDEYKSKLDGFEILGPHV